MRAKRVHTNPRPAFSSQLDRANADRRQSFGCGLAFVVVMIAAALAWGVWQAKISAQEKAASRRESGAIGTLFLTAAQQKNYTLAQSYLTPSAQYALSGDALSKSFAVLNKEWGSWLNTDLSNQELRSVAGLTLCDCDYTLVFDHGTATVRLVLVHGFRGWKVNTMLVQ